jgi:hypothetical protein
MMEVQEPDFGSSEGKAVPGEVTEYTWVQEV